MLSLTLSGGGFRATLFHLGTIAYLRREKLLGNVKQIYAVSGGSILATHLLLNWKKYTSDDDSLFAGAAREVVDFTRSDLRGRVLWRWLLFWLAAITVWVIPPNVCWFLVPGVWTSWWVVSAYALWLGAGAVLLFGRRLLPPFLRAVRPPSRAKWLEWEYRRLFNQVDYRRRFGNDVPLGALPPSPVLHLLCTDFTTGDLCSFSQDGFRFARWHPVEQKPDPKFFATAGLPVAFGVAASSAYPAVFPPVELTGDALGNVRDEEFAYPHYLGDGGVFENLGIRAWRWLPPPDDGAGAEVIVSDAQREIDPWWGRAFGTVGSRTFRTSDIFMKRVNELENYDLAAHGSFKAVRLHDPLPAGASPPPNVQRLVQNVRTDLDPFSPTEIQLLIYQGYAEALQAFQGPAAPVGGVQFSSNRQAPFPAPPSAGGPPPIWLPYKADEGRVKVNVSKALRRSTRNSLGFFPPHSLLWGGNLLLLLVFVNLLYPSLWLWKRAINQFPWQPVAPLTAAFISDDRAQEIINHNYLLSDLAMNPQGYRVVVLKAGPFIPWNPDQAVAAHSWDATLSESYKLEKGEAHAVLVSPEQSYISLDVGLSQDGESGRRSIHVQTPQCKGSDVLLVVLVGHLL
jgi:hypothetical protein